MRTRSQLASRRGVLSVATAGGLALGGAFFLGTLVTTTTLVVTDPLAPKASADSLTQFDSCTALRDWFVQHGEAEVGPYGWSGPPIYATEHLPGPTDVAGMAPQASSAGSGKSADARSSSSTGTNTQEADVDEPDAAKTDGRRVVRLIDQRVVVIDDVTGAEPRELGRIVLPVDAYGSELLLAGDHVLVSQTPGVWHGPMPADLGPADAKVMGPGGGTRIIDVDVSEPARPRIVHDDTYTGGLVSMRLYGDTVRLVTSTPRPALPWVTPGRFGDTNGRALSPDEATRRNRELVRATTIQDWLPAVVDNTTRSRQPLVDCADVYRPADWSGSDTTAVTTYDVRDPGHRTSVAVTADGQVVYSSTDRLYVASTQVDPPSGWGRLYGSVTGRTPVPSRPREASTQLHAFALDKTTTRYVGSGHVAGSVRDRWSLDEHDGLLRVAWTRTGTGMLRDANGETRQATRNGITVLAERDGALVPIGSIDDLGIDENIQSVRWFDDFAVLVTFRQMDPLYTIDLTDPGRPREIGRLKIPGYSGYLHPIGGDLLLGLGVDATDEGRNLGAQAAVFDIRDLADPRRLSQQRFGLYSYLPTLDDPHGFTWLPDQHTGVTTVAGGDTGRTHLVALHVDPTGDLEAHELTTDVGWNARTLPLPDGRVAVVDGQDVRLLSVA